MSHEPRIQELARRLRAPGHAVPSRADGRHARRAGPRRAACIRCNTCDGYPCLIEARPTRRWSASSRRSQHDNVTLLTNAQVARLETDAAGRVVTGSRRARRRRGRALRALPADIVVVLVRRDQLRRAAAALRERPPPHGLANRSDDVGRNYMGHINSVLARPVAAARTRPCFQKTLGAQRLLLRVDGLAVPDGAHLARGQARRATLSRRRAGDRARLDARRDGAHSLDFWLTSEDLPDPENRVTLDREGEIELAYTPNNGEGHTRLIGKLKALMRSSALRRARPRVPPGAARAQPLPRPAHPARGRRPPERHRPLRSRPATSVLDVATAARTRSTTSTSSTGASSRRAAR